MKSIILFSTLLCFKLIAAAQINIRDDAIINQQERMVFKSWDPDKFTPKPGFLGLNPLYWMTWGLHPNYPKRDLRPLSPLGPQTMRIGFALAMSAASDAYKKHSDTLSSTAQAYYMAYSPLLSDLDPLWSIYYSEAFADFAQRYRHRFIGLDWTKISSLRDSGLDLWYQEQFTSLQQRVSLSRSLPMERGSRILSYHRLLLEHRKLWARWEDAKSHVQTYRNLSSARERIKKRSSGMGKLAESDIEIANQILKNLKL